MYCPNCGKEISDDAMFCPYCGAKQEPSTDREPVNDTNNEVNAPSDTDTFEDAEVHESEQSTDNIDSEDNMSVTYDPDTGEKIPAGSQPGRNKRTSMPSWGKWLILAAAVVVVAVIVIIIAVSGSRPTIDMNKYLSVTDSGYNGFGSVYYDINYEQLMMDYGGKLKLTREGNNNFIFAGSVANGTDPVGMIYSDLDVSPDVSHNLSNGDQVVFSWDDSDVSMLETYIKVRIKTDDYIYTVSNLEDVETEDFFNYVSVTFSGVAPNGTANLHIDSDCDWLTASDFSLSRSDGLSNDSKVTVTIDEDAIQDILEEYGKSPVETEREYTVGGLGSYVTSLSQVPDDALQEMDEKGRQHITEEAEGYDDTIQEINLLGYYITKPNSRHDSSENEIYAIYEVKSRLNWSDPQYVIDYFTYIAYADGMVNGNGDFSINYSNLFYPVIDRYDWWTGYVKEGEGYTYEVDGEGIANVGGFETLGSLNESLASNGAIIIDSTVDGISV